MAFPTELLAAAVQASLDGLVVFRVVYDGPTGAVDDLEIRYVNAHAAALLGREAEAVVGLRLSQLIGQPLRIVAGDVGAAIRDGVPVERELAMQNPALAGRWVRYRLAAFDDGVVMNLEEITERKQAEAAQRMNEARFRGAAEGSLQGFGLLAPELDDAGGTQFRFTYVNANAEKILGQRPGSLVGRLLHELAPGSRHRFEVCCLEVLASGEAHIEEFHVRSPLLAERWLRVQFYPVGEEIAVAAEDITQRRAEEVRLAASEALHRAIVDTMHEGLYIMDGYGNITFANRRYASWVGREPLELIGHHALEFVAPEDRAFVAWKADVRRQGSEPTINRPVDIIGADGSRRTVLGGGALLPAEVGEGWILITVSDVTEQAIAQNALEASESRYRAIVDATHEGITVVDRLGTMLFVNERMANLLGRSVTDLTGVNFLEFVHREHRTRVAARGEAIRAGDPDEGHGDFRLVRADGAEVWVAGHGTVLDSPPGSLLVAIRDVTARRRSEEAAKVAAARYQTIVETANEGIFLTGADGVVVLANKRACELLGRPAEDLVGTQLASLIHRDDLRAALARIQRYLDGQQTEDQSELRLLRGDGTALPVLASTSALWDQDGTFEGAISMFVDLTERLAAEDARRDLDAQVAAAEERERRRLAEDLHDGPVQQLSALALRVGMMRRRNSNPELEERLIDGEHQLREVVSSLRSLMFQLLPPDLAHDGLANALQRMAASVVGEHGVAVSMRSKLEDDNAEAGPNARALYRIAREALVNVRKHAGAHEVAIDLADVDGGVLLTITDDGTGAPEGALDDQRPGHLGLRAVRDRAAAVGGWATIGPGPAGGTRLTTWVPAD